MDVYPNVCLLNNLDSQFNINSSDVDFHNAILGLCSFISAFVIFIACMIGCKYYGKKKALQKHLISQWEDDQRRRALDSQNLSLVSRMGFNSNTSGYGIGRSRRAMGDSLVDSMDRSDRWRGLYDVMPSSHHFPSNEFTNREGFPSTCSEMSSIGNTSVSDLAFCVKTSDIVFHKTLGEGFYGKVLSARWRGNWVAVKILKHKTADHLIEVQKEVSLLIRLRHPNVVPFYGCTAPPEPCIISELMWGSLFKLLHGDNPFCDEISEGSSTSTGREVKQPLSELVLFRIVNDISNGLSYIHDSGIIHRDVSSSNVLVTGSRRRLEALVRKRGLNVPAFAKITDFGLSRGVSAGLTSSAVNLSYLSPEGYRGESVTTQSDVFSFAVVAWEAYMCKRPYEDQPNEQIAAYRVTCEGLRPPITSKIPGGISILMQDCWVDDPQARPTMKAVVVFLEELQGLWRSHAKANQADENDSDCDSKWDGVAMKPAVNTYSAFDNDDYIPSRDSLGRSGSNYNSFRIGDIHEMDDGDSGQENNNIDLPRISLTLGNENKHVCPESSSSHRMRPISASSSSLCSLEQKANEQQYFSNGPSFVPTPLDNKGGGYGSVNDVYHEFHHESSIGVSSSVKEEEVDKQPDVPAVGESDEHGGGNNDAAAGNEG